MINQTHDFERLGLVSSLLGQHIPVTRTEEELPPEVARALIMARVQMQGIPSALRDLEAAKLNFSVLEKSLDRLVALTDEAAELGEEDQPGRDRLEVELVSLAHVVAKLAGRQNYDGPQISVKTKAHAQGSRKILRHLTPFKEDMALNLIDQENLIVEAIEQTIGFLEMITESYPEAASLTSIPDLLLRVSGVLGEFDAESNLVSAQIPGFH